MIITILKYSFYAMIGYFLFWIFRQFIWQSILIVFWRMKYGKKINMFSPFIFIKFLINPGRIEDKKDAAQPFMKTPLQKNKDMVASIGPGLFNSSYFFNDPYLIKQASQNHSKYKKQMDFLYFDKLFKYSLFITSGKLWEKQRKVIHSFFTFDSILNRKKEMEFFAEQTFQNFIENPKPDGLLFKLQRYTGDVMCSTFFGQEMLQKQLNGKCITEEVSNLLFEVITNGRYSRYIMYRTILFSGFTKHKIPFFLYTKAEKALIQRIENLRNLIFDEMNVREQIFQEEEAKGKNDFLQVQLRQKLKDQEVTSNEEIFQQFMGFYFAGMDTTAHTLLIALFCIAEYQDIQERLRKEIQSQFLNNDYNDIKKLSYLSAFINEVLRKFTPVTTPIQRTVEEKHNVGEFTLKKNDSANFNLLGLFNDPKYFHDPDNFNPDRWLDLEFVQNLDEFVFIPFFTGSRSCIGKHMALLETKIFIIKVLQKFKLKRRQDVEFSMDFKVMYTLRNDNIIEFEKIN